MATAVQRYLDRRVLVTGAGSGIGQACVLRILDEGGRVVAADISAAGLHDTASQAGDAAARLSTVQIDVGDEESVNTGVAEALGLLGGLDTLVNVAGILRSAHFLDTTLADFEQVLRVNLVGTFLVIRAALPALRSGTAPAVVNFSSTSATFAHPYMSAYAASKGGILAMTHALAAEFAKEGIRFNSVQPGSISSGMTDGHGESRQSVGPGLPADADFRLFQRVAPALRAAGRGDLRRSGRGGRRRGDAGQSGGVLPHRHRSPHRRRRTHVAIRGIKPHFLRNRLQTHGRISCE